MSRLPTPEERAAALVSAGAKEEGGAWFVRLQALGEEEVLLGPHPNPAVAREEADKVRRFVAAVIREARQAAD
jgi:hypothetical protein